MKRRRGIVAALASMVLALALWAFWLEPASLSTREHSLALPRWPQSCDGVRVAVLADLHVGSPWQGPAQLRKIVQTVNAARPDLVLLAGDYVIQGVVGGRFVTPEQIAAELAKLSTPLGTYAVLGNHDWWLDGPRITRALEAARIPVLEDSARQLARGDCRFWLAGIGDFWTAKHDVKQALSGVNDAAPVVLFTHNPDLFPEIPARVTLSIAGHTHGGQVRIPGIGRPVVPSRYGQRYAAGLVVEEGRHLFVSTGLGTSILPVRFLVPPEISILRLQAQP
ncbi:metallophosphoesterase [Solimonas sp. K1W22B-7]|uniref:metallophosphoesterase n=1 Tax=Solimonas sp. K1W22B-7 TaxID=2303331 RepID=UPI000E331B17|nr:metallophosphoesterase [Solimonas sp. K1W22B-7]AXQ28176.1 metallophosphoesterase [Solimonas sp. K1W22B-7]